MTFASSITIGSRTVSSNAPVFIIAEAGVNHNGSLEKACDLIDLAAEAGADAVKFQAFRTSELIIEGVNKAPYQVRETGQDTSQAEMLRGLELPQEAYAILKNRCVEKDIQFLITPFDEVSLVEICALGVDAIKIASTDATNIPFLLDIAATGLPMILSTGMCSLEDVRCVLDELAPVNNQIILLQCTANYPIQADEVHLRVMDTFSSEFGILPGYSDHSEGIGAGPYAVARGAKVLEKHFTFDRAAVGPDHKASLDPEQLKTFVGTVRQVEQMLGGTSKELCASENDTRISLQKCLVARTDIAECDTFSRENLTAKRTGGLGMSPLEYKRLLGQPASRAYQKNEIIEEPA